MIAPPTVLLDWRLRCPVLRVGCLYIDGAPNLGNKWQKEGKCFLDKPCKNPDICFCHFTEWERNPWRRNREQVHQFSTPIDCHGFCRAVCFYKRSFPFLLNHSNMKRPNIVLLLLSFSSDPLPGVQRRCHQSRDPEAARQGARNRGGGSQRWEFRWDPVSVQSVSIQLLSFLSRFCLCAVAGHTWCPNQRTARQLQQRREKTAGGEENVHHFNSYRFSAWLS